MSKARAKRRLADEYDAAQDRGEVATVGKRSQPERLTEAPPSAAQLGLSRKDIHEARLIRDAEQAEPGIVRRALDEDVDAGRAPTRRPPADQSRCRKPSSSFIGSRRLWPISCSLH
ncbi:MAG: hypothetical protein KIT48_12080 [Pseudolabrys sp.]|nr:hypothetical protein [Pseudolabrys sp.]